MTNADMILRLIQLHLPEFINQGLDGDTDLSEAYCTAEACTWPEETDIKQCRRCLDAWLEKPYDGRFTMEQGRFVVAEEELKEGVKRAEAADQA